MTTAERIIIPPMSTLTGGISLKNSQTHIGANIDSININKPTITAGVVLEPIVIKIKPKANCGTPSKNANQMSFVDIAKFSSKSKPYRQLNIPA